MRSERAGERVMKWMQRYLEEELKLKVNQDKSAVSRPEQRSFLGFTFERGKRKVKVKMANKSWKRFQGRVRSTTRRGLGCSLENMIQRLNRYLQGWSGYYRLAETRSTMQQIDAWIRRRLRCFILRQWKRPKTRANELRKLGAKESWSIISSKGLWRLSKSKAVHSGLNNTFFKERGLYSLSEAWT